VWRPPALVRDRRVASIPAYPRSIEWFEAVLHASPPVVLTARAWSSNRVAPPHPRRRESPASSVCCRIVRRPSGASRRVLSRGRAYRPIQQAEPSPSPIHVPCSLLRCPHA
jgi:hypothetical protein